MHESFSPRNGAPKKPAAAKRPQKRPTKPPSKAKGTTARKRLSRAPIDPLQWKSLLDAIKPEPVDPVKDDDAHSDEDGSSEHADNDRESMGGEDVINNAADKRSESATSTPHIVPSTQFYMPSTPSTQFVGEQPSSPGLRRNPKNASGEVVCFQCGKMTSTTKYYRCLACGNMKTKMYRLFQKEPKVKSIVDSWSKETKQSFCAANHFSKDLKAAINEVSEYIESDVSGDRYTCDGNFRDDVELAEKYHNRPEQLEAI